MTTDEFKHLCDLTLELTKLKLEKVGHLAIENFAEETLHKLIHAAKDKPVERAPREWFIQPSGAITWGGYEIVPSAHIGCAPGFVRVREVLPE